MRINLFFFKGPRVWAFPPSDGWGFWLLLWNDIFATKRSHIINFMNYSQSSLHEMYPRLESSDESKKKEKHNCVF